MIFILRPKKIVITCTSAHTICLKTSCLNTHTLSLSLSSTPSRIFLSRLPFVSRLHCRQCEGMERYLWVKLLHPAPQRPLLFKSSVEYSRCGVFQAWRIPRVTELSHGSMRTANRRQLLIHPPRSSITRRHWAYNILLHNILLVNSAIT